MTNLSLTRVCMFLLSVVVVAACGSGDGPRGGESTSTTNPDDSTTSPDDEAMSTTSTSRDLAVPDEVVQAAVEQAVRDTGIEHESLEVVSAKQVVWSDASLDCPQEGQSYIQVLTDGYWVVLDSPEGELDYRSSLESEFRRCPNGQDPHSTQPEG